jgi:hypothetical protein
LRSKRAKSSALGVSIHALLRHPRQHRAIALARVAPHDRAQRGVGLHRRAVDADLLAVHQAALGHEQEDAPAMTQCVGAIAGLGYAAEP